MPVRTAFVKLPILLKRTNADRMRYVHYTRLSRRLIPAIIFLCERAIITSAFAP